MSRAQRPFSLGPWIVLLLLVFGWGLTRDLTEPWVGMHDWNGAFYSQLARNLLRYPFDAHWGMPIIAVGQSLPTEEDRSFYATHPPALIWLVAGSFALLGDSEAAARLVPISASLISLGLFVWIVSRAYGSRAALCSGVLYVVMPMSVYFGRMVNHEPVCLACMMAVVAATLRLLPGGEARGRVVAWITWFAAMFLGVWTDWPGSLFAGLLLLGLAMELASHRPLMPHAARLRRMVMAGMVLVSIAGMTAFLVYSGLDGRWSDLVAVFFSRTGLRSSGAFGRDPATAGGSLIHTVENLTPALLALVVFGIVMRAGASLSRRRRIGLPSKPEARASDSDPASESARIARTGLHLICVTGLLWLVSFPRQYLLHNYWLYYLGPAAALYAGLGLLHGHALIMKRGRMLATLGCGAILILVVGAEIRGVRDYFRRLAYIAPVEDLQIIREMTAPDEWVLLFGDFINLELRGGYRLRSIVPPQFAYYLDRPFLQTRSMSDAVEAGRHNCLFVISKADAVRQGQALEAVRRQCVEQPLEHLVVFKGRRHGRGPDAGPRTQP